MRSALPWLLAAALGVVAALLWARGEKAPAPDAPALVEQVREVLRLETLEVSLYKKISFEPDPEEKATLWGELMEWARFTVSPPRGRAIVFAEAHLGFDFRKLGPDAVRIERQRAIVKLPKMQVVVELKPGETEIIGSNLNSAQTAELLERAKKTFEAEVLQDQALERRARQSAERAIRGVLAGAGVREVVFVEETTTGAM